VFTGKTLTEITAEVVEGFKLKLVAPAHRREAIEALARGERLRRSGTQTGTSAEELRSVSLVSVG
jgi:hypothetical protein